MNYLQALAKARTLLQQGHNAQAVQTAAAALESLLVEIYNQLLGQSVPARQKQLVEAQERIGGGQALLLETRQIPQGQLGSLGQSRVL